MYYTAFLSKNWFVVVSRSGVADNDLMFRLPGSLAIVATYLSNCGQSKQLVFFPTIVVNDGIAK